VIKTRFFNILQLYMLREIVGPALLGLLVFTFLLFTTEIFDIVEILISTNVTVREAVELLACIIATLFPLTIPMSLLLGVLLGLGRLSADREILALRAGGVHTFRVIWPIIAVSAALSALMMIGNFNFTPGLYLRAEDISVRVLFKVASSLKEGRVHSDIKASDTRASLYFRERDEDTGNLTGVALRLGGQGEGVYESEVVAVAPKGLFAPDEKNGVIRLEMDKGTLHLFDSNEPDEYSIASFDALRRDIRLNIINYVDGRPVKDPAMMTVSELLKGIRRDDVKIKRSPGVTRLNIAVNPPLLQGTGHLEQASHC